jgi:hypothetical protein
MLFFDQWDRSDLISIMKQIVFKMNLIDAVKSIHCAEVCSSWNFSINSLMLFQYIYHSALNNTLMYLTASFCEMTQKRPIEDGSTA